MRGRDQPWHRFQQFRHAQDRTNRQVGAADSTLARSASDADLLLGAAEDENGLSVVRLGNNLYARGTGLGRALREFDLVRVDWRGRLLS
jgi:hypothetical protein